MEVLKDTYETGETNGPQRERNYHVVLGEKGRKEDNFCLFIDLNAV